MTYFFFKFQKVGLKSINFSVMYDSHKNVLVVSNVPEGILYDRLEAKPIKCTIISNISNIFKAYDR